MATEHPSGVFQATVLDHGFNKASTGTTQFWVKYQTERGDIVAYFAMTDKSVEYTAEKVRAMGFDGGDWRALADGSALRGAICNIEIKADTYNGVTRNKVAAVWSIDGDRPGQLSHEDAVSINVARFNAVLKRAPAQGQPRTKRGPTVEDFDQAEAADAGQDDEPPPSDDSIPF
ncbi:MAG: hypothetical protein WC789_09205 [Lentisphaeria bacterium]